VRITVQDSGSDIEPEKHGTLFEAFYSTKPQGHWMGLRISRSIVAAFNLVMSACRLVPERLRLFTASGERFFDLFTVGRPKVLMAAKTYGSVFYDKLSPSIAREKW
jgi:hypothetical protein